MPVGRVTDSSAHHGAQAAELEAGVPLLCGLAGLHTHLLPQPTLRCLAPPPCLSCPQCEAVLPTEEFEDGTKPPKKWNHYQLWWQTIMTKIAPELRALGWGNLK